MAKEKRNNYKFWHSPLALAVLFLLLIFFSYKIFDLIKKERETTYQKELNLNRIEKLNKQIDDLSKDTAKITTTEGEEEIIRDKFMVAKPDEKMVIIVDEEKGSISSEKKEESHGFWNWLKGIFKK